MTWWIMMSPTFLFETVFVLWSCECLCIMKVNKCCKRNEALDPNGHMCIASENATSDFEWFPYGAMENSSRSSKVQIDPQYGKIKRCALDSGRTLSWREDDRLIEYRLDPSLWLKEYYYKSLNPRLRAVIPPSEYCVDRNDESKRYVMKFCPCQVIPCVRKCCLPGFFFSLMQNVCLPNPKKNESFNVQFYKKKKPLIARRPKHYVYHSFPKCKSIGLKPLNLEPHEKHSFYIQADGSVQVYKESGMMYSLKSHRYCMDEVLSHENASETNLILCKDSNVIFRGRSAGSDDLFLGNQGSMILSIPRVLAYIIIEVVLFCFS